jgi:hypothetical protein
MKAGSKNTGSQENGKATKQGNTTKRTGDKQNNKNTRKLHTEHRKTGKQENNQSGNRESKQTRKRNGAGM